MKTYISHKRVRAAQIVSVAAFEHQVSIRGSDGVVDVAVPDNFFGRGVPEIGDYLVSYKPDGYMSWSPKAAFEGGYRPVGAPLEVIHQDGTFSVGFSSEREGGGFTVLGDITDQIPFIGSVVAAGAPTSGMSFGDAIVALKAGQRVARAGWNGKGMWLKLILAGDYQLHREIDVALYEVAPLSWIGMKTADEKFVPWLASQTDMLAEDWVIVG